MADTLFFTEDPLSDLIELSAEESHHALKVSRLADGDTISLTDGKGMILNGLVRTNKKVCCVEIISREQQMRRSSGLELAVSALKSTDRLMVILEKAVELSVAAIHLFISENSSSRLPSKDKINRKLIAGLKQSKNAYLPEVHFHQSVQELLNGLRALNASKPLYFGHCHDGGQKRSLSQVELPGIICIGPEADFSLSEVQELIDSNAMELHLGPNRLRAETAALLSMSYAYQVELGNIAK